jgi:hypothetical protein
MNEILIALVLHYTTQDNLDLDLICRDIKAEKLTADQAQQMLDAQNEKLNGYEIQIDEICVYTESECHALKEKHSTATMRVAIPACVKLGFDKYE